MQHERLPDEALSRRLAFIEARISPRIPASEIQNVRRDVLWLIKQLRIERQAHA